MNPLEPMATTRRVARPRDVLLVSGLLLAACGQAFSAGSGDGGAATDAGGVDGRTVDGPGGGADGPGVGVDGPAGSDGPATKPDGSTDGSPSSDAAVPDSSGHDATSLDVNIHDVNVVDVPVTIGVGCDAAKSLRVFVTSQQYAATDIGSLANADKICQATANGAGLAGAYVAWISDDTTSAINRICPTTVPFVLVDGTTVALGTIGLTSATLAHAIDETETGAVAPTTPSACGSQALSVWTGTEYNGQGQADSTCDSWTTSDPNASGVVGFAQATTGAWTYGCSGSVCQGTASLYCIEQ
jgi:hypothetical protein